jgi:hypothetical protein
MKIEKIKSGIDRLLNDPWLRSTAKALRYALYVIVHPFDGFWDLKNEKRGNFTAATIIVAAVLMTRLLSLQYTNFLFMDVYWEEVNIWVEIAQIVLPLIIWVVANRCLSTLFDGRGDMMEVYIATAYALVPYVLIQLPMCLYSNIATAEEGAVYTFFGILSYAWCIGLMLVGLMQTHDYTMSRTVLFVGATLVGMIVIIVLCLLVFSMASETVAYFTSLISEIVLRFYS